MTQTTKRRITLFPFFQNDGLSARPDGLDLANRIAPNALADRADRHLATAIITARGQRFSLRQIGSMFGSE